ncbi:MAG: beta-N-acetylglucosaminidase domain-containing protein [Chloroflexota bacterium]
MKGLWWSPHDYHGWPDLLADHGFNFLMLCYTFSPRTALHWRGPFKASDRRHLRALAAASRARGVDLCLAIHPFIGAHGWDPRSAGLTLHPTARRDWFAHYWRLRRPGLAPADPGLRYGVAEDVDLLAAKIAQACRWGVTSVALCLDDIDPEAVPLGFDGLAEAQLWLVQRLRDRLTRLSAQVRLLLVPTYYWTDGIVAHPEYAAALAAGLPLEVDLFWTGRVVRQHDISAPDAIEATALLGRTPVVWLNYSSNDSFRFLPQLPPDRPPPASLGGACRGLLVNVMRQQSLARMDAFALGAYLRDPAGYNHESALERAALQLVGTGAADLLLRFMRAWLRYPDPRTLPRVLADGGEDAALSLRETTTALHAETRSLHSELTAALGANAVVRDLGRGVRRLGLLARALKIRCAPGDDLLRERFERLLATTPEEQAADAQAVLSGMR